MFDPPPSMPQLTAAPVLPHRNVLSVLFVLLRGNRRKALLPLLHCTALQKERENFAAFAARKEKEDYAACAAHMVEAAGSSEAGQRWVGEGCEQAFTG